MSLTRIFDLKAQQRKKEISNMSTHMVHTSFIVDGVGKLTD